MIRRPPRSTQSRSSAASDVYKRQGIARGSSDIGCWPMKIKFLPIRKQMPRLFKISLKTLQFFCLSLLIGLAFSQQVDAKRSARPATSPVKISDVVVSPDPFIIGKSGLKLTLLVELPSSLRGANV